MGEHAESIPGARARASPRGAEASGGGERGRTRWEEGWPEVQEEEGFAVARAQEGEQEGEQEKEEATIAVLLLVLLIFQQQQQ